MNKFTRLLSMAALVGAALMTAPQAKAWCIFCANSDVIANETPAAAEDQLSQMVNGLSLKSAQQRWGSSFGDSPSAAVSSEAAAVTDLSQTLPDISNFPVPVLARPEANLPTVEIFSSTEKSTDNTKDKKTDDWLNQVARKYNASTSKIGRVSVRSIDSGVSYQYIVKGVKEPATAYIPDAFSPSNDLWIRMSEAKGMKMTKVSDSLVSNVAGVVIRKAKLAELDKTESNFTLMDLIVAAKNGQLKMGYTNPFSSSTGLNFMTTILQTLADGFKGDLSSPEVIAEFRNFQKAVPITFETTLQLRDAIKSGERLDAMVMEYQTYSNLDDVKNDCAFIPFGERHENPLYAVGDLAPEKVAVLEDFAKFVQSQPDFKGIAQQLGFYGRPEYKSAKKIDGATLIQMQQLWKAEKSAGSEVSAIFLGDISGSMTDDDKIETVKKALQVGANFIRPQNSIGLIVFDEKVTRALDVKKFDEAQKNDFLAVAQGLAPSGSTAMYDGISVALTDLIKQAKAVPGSRQVLIILTDGVSNKDRLDITTIKKLAAKIKIPIYIMGLEGRDPDPDLRADLKATARSTGGDSFIVKPETVENQIANLLNSQL